MQVHTKSVCLPRALMGCGTAVCAVSSRRLFACGPYDSQCAPVAVHIASQRLHANHQEPFVLSRMAASSAIASVASPGEPAPSEPPVAFSGSRSDALRDHGAHISLSHEDLLGAAVAWRAQIPLDGLGRTFAVDIADLCDVQRVRTRFPQFRARWLGPCRVPFPRADGDGSGQKGLVSGSGEEQLTTISRALSVALGPHQHHQHQQGEWWRVFISPEVAANTAVLAQHWSLRECCVKLLGIQGRSFDYNCVACGDTGVEPTLGDAEEGRLASLPRGFFAPNVVYTAAITGNEKSVFQSCGRLPRVHVTSWIEWVQPALLTHGSTDSRHAASEWPYFVTVASCENQSGSGASLE